MAKPSLLQEAPVQTIALGDLKHDPHNPRLHPDDNLALLCKSLERFGQPEPLVVQASTRMVISGNGRLEAMRKLGWPAARVQLVDWDDETARAYSIVANRSAELARWDTTQLDAAAQELKAAGWELETDLGFKETDLTDLVRAGESLDDLEPVVDDSDDVPAPPANPRSRPGDVWVMGKHRLLCGDSRDNDAIRALFGKRRADAVITDPPYGVSYVGKTKDALTIDNDGADDLRGLLAAALKVAYDASRPGAIWYVWAPAGPQFLDFAVVMMGLEVWRQTLVWVKDQFVLGHSDYHYRHEVALYGWKEGPHIDTPDRRQDTVWEVPRPKRSEEHPTMKPVDLITRCIANSTRKGDLVYEPFAGSGTAFVAAEQLGRVVYGVELDPGYADVCVQRWEKFTGQKAHRESDMAPKVKKAPKADAAFEARADAALDRTMAQAKAAFPPKADGKAKKAKADKAKPKKKAPKSAEVAV